MDINNRKEQLSAFGIKQNSGRKCQGRGMLFFILSQSIISFGGELNTCDTRITFKIKI